MVRLQGIQKSFADKVVLKDINLQIREGSILALAGENGAGKSTLMNILCGVLAPDHGEIHINENVYPQLNTTLAKTLGIAMVHQHFLLDDELSVLDNLILTSPDKWVTESSLPLGFQLLPRKQATHDLEAQIPEEAKLEIAMGEVSVGTKQRLEILRVVMGAPKIVIFDEPTACLNEIERQKFFARVKQLKENGAAVVYISHKLAEIFTLADSIVVLRKGECSAPLNPSETSVDQVAQMMVGEIPISTVVPQKTIVGIAGVEGNGQKNYIQKLLAGCDRKNTGYVSDDRLKESVVASMTLLENWKLSGLSEDTFARCMEAHDVKPRESDCLISELSGGNQQKFVIAREIQLAKKMFIVCEPTRGVDVKAKQQIHEAICRVAAQGVQTVVVSSDLEELMHLSQTIKVLYRGQWIAEFSAPPFDSGKIALAMAGVAP